LLVSEVESTIEAKEFLRLCKLGQASVLDLLTMICNYGKLRRRWAPGSVAFLILLSCPCIVCASLVQYHAEVRTVDYQLPLNTVSAILQTRDEYLWLATKGGRARYDGDRFKTFEFSSIQGMTSNRILYLCDDIREVYGSAPENQGLMRIRMAYSRHTPASKTLGTGQWRASLKHGKAVSGWQWRPQFSDSKMECSILIPPASTDCRRRPG